MANNYFLEPLNVAKGNMYEFVTHTWNPIKGICVHQCKYCYMRNLLSERYKSKPVLVENEFKRNLDEAKVLFVGSSIDMFAKDVPDAFIMRVLNHCELFNESRPEKGHIVYLFQSKDPTRILKFAKHPVMKHAVVATTLETNRYNAEIMGNAPAIEERASAMEKIDEMGIYTMVTAEPLMDFDKEEFVELIKRCKPRRINIGRNSTRNIVLPEPTADKVKDLVSTLREFTRVHIKNNAKVWSAE
ncbi:MAG: hypothetical protein IJ614_06315 [Prevotella sp.]|nr:hypothetical protein [Prevotella sp.]